jgi:zona occludens toxin (predicted ATPase)
MKAIWIKLIVALALVFLVVFWGIIFWPVGTEPEDNTVDLKAPPRAQQTRVESLYQTAVFHKERDNPSDMDFRITADCCRRIHTDYPNTPEAEIPFTDFLLRT